MIATGVCRVHDLRAGKPPEGQLDEGKRHEGGRVSARFSKFLARRRFRPNQEKVRSTPAAGGTTKPLVSSLRLPISVGAAVLLLRSFNLPRVVAAIGPAQFEPRAATAYFVEDQSGLIAVLDRGGVDGEPHRQPFAIDRGVDIAALHLLAGVVTHLGLSCRAAGRSTG